METIKEEKKADLEQLLNSLIEKGRKPFGKGGLNLRKLSGIHKGWLLIHEPSTRVADNYSLRDLVSKSSGLWQFVCENGMVREGTSAWKNYNDLGFEYRYYPNNNPGYWIISSALCDEDELEDFLLSNIKIDGTTK